MVFVERVSLGSICSVNFISRQRTGEVRTAGQEQNLYGKEKER